MIRYIVGIFLVLIIICLGIYSYIHKDELFKQEIVLSFPDGCKEKYINGELQGSRCEEGRRLAEEEENPKWEPMNININS